jgi:hypothetical protein
MRLNSASFAINDERITVRAKNPDGIGEQFNGPTSRAIKSQGMATEPAIRLEIFLPHLTEFHIPTFFREFLRQDAIFKKYNSDGSRLLMFVISLK